jgi:hypothetical protein
MLGWCGKLNPLSPSNKLDAPPLNGDITFTRVRIRIRVRVRVSEFVKP